MGLVFELTDLKGNVLAEFGQRGEVSVNVGLPQVIGPGTAELTLAMDEAGSQLAAALTTRLRVLLDGYPILYGPVGTPARDYDAGTLKVSAADPGVQLQAAYVEIPVPWPRPPSSVDPETGEILVPPDWQVYGLSFSAVDQGQIMVGLVNHARAFFGDGPDHGIATGSVPASRTRDRSYEPGKQIFQAMVELANVRGGPDWFLRAVTGLGKTCCLLDVFPDKMGENRSGTVVFSYGAAEANCRNVVDAPQGFRTVTRAIVLGQAEQGVAPPFWMAGNPESMRTYGVWESFDGRPDVSEGPTVKQEAEETVSALAVPPPQMTIVPAVEPGVGVDERLGVPPRFGPRANLGADYWIGDTVRAVASRSGHRTDRTGRVVAARITELPNGAVQVEPTLGGLEVAGVEAI